jgi:hypothetical protein
MTSSVPMRVKGRRTTTYQYNELEQLTSEFEEYLEPVDEPVKPGEFDGDDLTESLDHGQVPEKSSETEQWRLYKVYEKKAIWIRKGEEKKLE